MVRAISLLGAVLFAGMSAAPPASVPGYLKHQAIRPAAIVAIHEGGGKILNAASLLGSGPVRVEVGLSSGMDWPYLILDFGKEISGRVVLTSSENAVVEVATGESLEEVEKSPWKTDAVESAAGNESGTDYTGFRYAKVTFRSRATYTELQGDFLHYPVTYRGSFESSDPVLNRIWDTGAYTAQLCMQEEIWDAPKRDRRAWMGDLHVTGEVIETVFADTFLMEKTLAKLREDAQGGRAPDDAPVQHVNRIPGYSCAWIAALADFYRHSGDLDFLQSQKKQLISMLDYLKDDLDGRGVFWNWWRQWVFVDWAPKLDANSPESRRATHFFMAYAAQEAAFLLRELGESRKADETAAWAEALRNSARTYLVDPETGTYGDLRQVNAMAILAGIPTAEQLRKIDERVFAPGSEAWKQLATPYYNFYVVRALARLGKVQQALDFVRSYWGGMLDLGATTFWEAYDPSWPKVDFHSHLQADGETGTMVSLSHGWSSGPTAWLTETVLGVQPIARGFDVVSIQPELGDLAWAQGVVPTPHGDIRLRVERVAGGERLRLTLPTGIRAQVALRGVHGEIDREISAPGDYLIAN